MELGARAVPGAALIADEVGLDDRLAGAGLCITAEGRIDEQTLHGKAVAETVARARAAGVPVVAVGGQVRLSAGRLGAEVLECGDLELAGRELAASALAAVGGDQPAVDRGDLLGGRVRVAVRRATA